MTLCKHRQPFLSRLFMFVVVALGMAMAALGISCRCGDETNSAQHSSGDFDEDNLPGIAQWIHLTWSESQTSAPTSLAFAVERVFVTARVSGQKQAEAWGTGKSAAKALESAFAELRAQLRAEASTIDSLDIFLVTGSESIDPLGQRQRLFTNANRGVLGLQIEYEGKKTQYSPTAMLADNRRNERQVELFGKENELTEGVLRSLPYWLLHGPQVLVQLGDSPLAIPMHRGNTLVATSQIIKSKTIVFVDGMASWMWNNLHPDGRMTDLYWPSLSKEATGQANLSQQWTATIALEELAKLTNDAESWQRCAANIDYNLLQYYKQDGDRGWIEARNVAPLGATALAALAIIKHPDREKWLTQEKALIKTIDSLWQSDGSFQTYYKPSNRNDSQNFYSGDALVLWATLYAENHDEALLKRFMTSFAYYKAWHLARESIEDAEEEEQQDRPIPGRRKPAFIPRHTQAYSIMWRETKHEGLRDFIFEMNDWILEIQQWDDLEHPEMQGRFHDKNQSFGPPLASMTGFYLDGLIEAFAVARLEYDGKRAGYYAEVLRRGLRSLMQLQFVDDIDMFYVVNKSRVRGGLRSTVYDNQIRGDNVHNSLLATLKILRTDILGTTATID